MTRERVPPSHRGTQENVSTREGSALAEGAEWGWGVWKLSATPPPSGYGGRGNRGGSGGRWWWM